MLGNATDVENSNIFPEVKPKNKMKGVGREKNSKKRFYMNVTFALSMSNSNMIRMYLFIKDMRSINKC